MSRMTLLFPGSYINYREIEEDMQEEYLAAEETGLFRTVLFNYDEWLAGDLLRIRSDEAITNPVIYRGWMLKPNEYEELYLTLELQGIQLLTSPEEYQNLHLFPNVYPDIREDTAGMMIFEDGDVDVETVKRAFPRFMVKDSVKSAKGTEFPAFFDRTVTQQEFDEWTCTPPEELIKKYSGLKSLYYTVDYAEMTDGTWKIIEAGDGGVSGLSPGQDAAAYFRALYQAIKDMKT